MLVDAAERQLTEEILACVARLPRDEDFPKHLANRVALSNYWRIAREIASSAPPGAILDWGCGFAQLSCYLRRLGMEVSSFDVQRPRNIGGIAPLAEIPVTVGSPEDDLPYQDASFSSVLSCGVLEHVEEPQKSLAEIRRILRPAGVFFIYFLPNRYSWTEWLSRRRARSDHPVLYTPGSARRLLESGGLRVVRVRRSNFLPRNLTGLPAVFGAAYGTLPGLIAAADAVMSRVPLVNQICGVLELRAVKE
jgi:SAM-dependent methyltransferase